MCPRSRKVPHSVCYVEGSGDFSNGQIGSIQTGFAIANPSPTSAVVSFDLLALDGTAKDQSATLVLPGNGQQAMFLNQLSGFESLPTPFQGVLEISASSAAGISVTGLHGRYNERGDFLITATPPIDDNRSASASEVLFPHFADGGGYSTQFVLLAGPTSGSTGVIRFFGQAGQLLSLSLR